MTITPIEIIALPGIPLVSPGDDIVPLILNALMENDIELHDRDIFVIAHTIVSKSEGRIVDSASVVVSEKAKSIAEENGFDPIQVQVAISESKEILREKRALITRLKSGHICNFSGVDRSNAPVGSFVLLPLDADRSAEKIKDALETASGKSIAVIISDTEGRPWRKGAVNLAIGCSGINAFKYNEGKHDLYDRTLQHSLVCQIDQVASASEMLMGQADEGIPVVIIRGYDYEQGTENSTDIHRALDENLFK
ncbi:MAG: coenzyme F420-0:L-glutamate ligase [Candidatus Thorarchaeota archaeon]